MRQNKLIWLLTASESLASNLEELLAMDGYSCVVSKAIREVKDTFNERLLVQAFVLDELNNKGGYGELLKMLTGKKDIKIIVLSDDNDKTEYPLADWCLELPANIDGISDALSKC